MSRDPERTAATRLAALLPLLGWLGACGAPAPREDPDAAEAAEGRPEPALTAARYLTHLLYAGAAGSALFASFDQEADVGRLTVRYDVWWGDGSAWGPLLRARDTLPTPRAGWRVLPTAGMTVRVGGAGQIVGLSFARGGEEALAPVRLEAGEELSVWTGPTGQRESLGVAALQSDDAPEPGILFFRRAARALRISPTEGGTRAFVLADSVGNALLIEAGAGAEPASARTWLHGEASSWSEVELEAAPDSAAGEWRFAITGTDLTGTIRARASEAPEGPGPFPIECTLRAGLESFRFVGVSALLELP